MTSITHTSNLQTISSNGFIIPAWTAPDAVHALSTTRTLPGNIATHVDDDPKRVARNRQHLIELAGLPNPPKWLQQQHTAVCLNADHDDLSQPADASYSDTPGTVLAIMTADCLPINLCNENEIAAIHAGWQSLGLGIIEQTLKHFKEKPTHAWLGPAISQPRFEIGPEVRALYLAYHDYLAAAFQANPANPVHHFLCLRTAATLVLNANGIEDVTDSGHCTYDESEQFFSYRRDKVTGRIATLVWIEQAESKAG